MFLLQKVILTFNYKSIRIKLHCPANQLVLLPHVRIHLSNRSLKWILDPEKINFVLHLVYPQLPRKWFLELPEGCAFPLFQLRLSDEKAETAPALSLSESCSLQMESQYRVLIVNWVPPPLQNEHPKFDDQEWLFQRRQPRSDTIQKTNTCSYDFCHGSCILYPYAHYLPEVDIYALPYTVLF